MSFKSLLYCPDEKNARLVTQVLSDLDFTVEPASEPFAAVKRLTDELFDAVVVDCQNDQDASLLFKAARNSSQNHSSLAVAIVEGQAGVAKAFRIGANLVLTKPINVEQSKSTLRVARGLLKKNQAKPTAASQVPTTGPSATLDRSQPAGQPLRTGGGMATSIATTPRESYPGFAGPIAATAQTSPIPQATNVQVPFAAIEVEKEPTPEPEAADAAVLESLPQLSRRHVPEMKPLAGQPTPISIGMGGQAAAAALAPEKKPELKITGMAPLVTNEPIVSDVTSPESFIEEPVPAPSFSSLGTSGGESSGGKRFLKIAMLLAVLGGGAYFGWPKLRTVPVVTQFLSTHSLRQASGDVSQAQQTVPAADTSAAAADAGQNSVAAPIGSSQNATAPGSSKGLHDFSAPAQSEAQGGAKPIETIEVTEAAPAQGTNNITATPTPIIVKQSEGAPKPAESNTAPVPPPVNIASADSTQIADLVENEAALPKPAPGTIRISQGVSQGLLLKKVPPEYPSIAKQLHKAGTVQLLATVSKYGDITKVQVLGGDPMLARAAVDAVKQWEYRPYLLNGQPVEIETQVTIVFRAQ